MAKLKASNPRLTDEEFVALTQVGNRPMQGTIMDKDRDRLIAAGYIREIVRTGSGTTLVLTGSGMRRLERGK